MNRKIIETSSLDNETIVVLAQLLDNEYTPFVTWLARKDSPEATFLGHYFENITDAVLDYQKRLELEDKITKATETYFAVEYLTGVDDVNGKPFTKRDLIRWSLNPTRKYICVFCQNLSDEFGCYTCHEYKGIIPFIGGDLI
jgi:hypothetical protein